MVRVYLSLDCIKKKKRYYRLCSLNNLVERSKVKVLIGLVFFLFSRWLSHYVTVSSHGAERKKQREQAHALVASSFRKGTNAIMGASPTWPHLNPIISQKLHLQIPSHGEWELQHMNLVGGHKRSVHNRVNWNKKGFVQDQFVW